MCLNKLVRVYSAIQPSGQIHVGNYCGAIQQWISIQEKSDLILGIADLHGLTSHDKTVNYKTSVYNTLAGLLACGISPQKCIFYRQSDVKEHLELYWILSTVVNLPRLTGMSHYKEKSQRLSPTLALCGYPLLMAADIMLYKSKVVPVGEDQRQHIELVGHASRAFNEAFNCKIFECDVTIGQYGDFSKIKSLRDGTSKMSKSDKNPKSVLNLFDEPEIIKGKIKSALTDSQTSVITHDSENRPGLSNLLEIYSGLFNKNPAEVVRAFEGSNIVKFKETMAEDVVEVLRPLREDFVRLLADVSYLDKVMEMGKVKAKEIAEETMRQVNKAVGI